MSTLFSPTLEPAAVHGREAELAALAELLSARRRVVLHGPAGIGKTTLAAAAAHRFRATGEAAQVVCLSLSSGADVAWVVDAMGVLLEGPAFIELPQARRLPAVLKAVASRPTLVVWDHLDRVLGAPWSGETAALRPILELGVELTQAGRTRLIVVGREGDLGYVPYQPSRRVEVLEVGPLDAAGAGALAAPALLEAAGGNPLALRLLAAGGAADAAVRGDPLEGAFTRFWASLDEPARQGISALATLRDGGAEEALRSIVGAEPALSALLERAGLACRAPAEGAGPYLSLHDSLRTLLPAPTAEAEELHRRAYMELGYQWSSGESPWHRALVLRELPNLLIAFARSLEEDRDHVAALADALQEIMGPPPPGVPTLNQRVLSTAGAMGLAVAHPVGV
jgi:hypothetical protein